MSPASRRDRWNPGFPPPAPPRPVKDGLVARSTRGSIGEQWWSRRFIAVMESFALGTRLTRGRAYARRGQVISVDVARGEVTASVQGSRVRPYTVRVGLPAFPEPVWAEVEVRLAEEAIHCARLLAGEFPPELEPVFAALGAPLFPERYGELKLRCSCPDDAVPCKHLAAVFYLLAERFDDDPFLILRWRGRDREALLARLAELRGDAPASPPGAAGAAPPHAQLPGAALALPDDLPAGTPGRRSDTDADTDSGADDALTFWTAGVVPPLPSHPPLPPDLLLRHLPVPGGAIGGPRLVAELTPLYERLAGD